MKTPARRKPKIGVPIKLPTSLHDRFVTDMLSVISSATETAIHHVDLVFKFGYQAQRWLSKFSDQSTTSPADRRTAAIKKWLLAEVRNQRTNQRLLLDDVTFNGNVTSSQIVKFARMVIRQTIGDSPSADLFGKFSNGASTRVRRGPDAIARKFVGEAHVTPEAYEIFKTQVLATSPAWVQAMMNGTFKCVVQPGSMMFTVPKDSEIDRVACKEPEINMFLQRGAGVYLRSQLRKRGINLKDQTLNQRLAFEGSVSRKLATLDLSSASDLISVQLVYDLLPLDWFLYLDAIRVKRVLIDGEWHELSMFSSMGNGFTFELESLIFYALSCAINRAYGVRGRISVYGDDIVTPSAIAATYVRVFAWFGFKVNPKKSFWTGGFRESCGKHYYKGYDVTPFFLRSRVGSLPDLMHQLNQLRAWATRVGDDFWTPELHSFWEKWSREVPPKYFGGKNVADITCLCTVDRPRRRLQAEKREISAPNDGAYLQWLLARSSHTVRVLAFGCGDSAPLPVKREVALSWLAEYEEFEPLVTSKPTLELAHYRAVKNREQDGTKLTELWFRETL